MCRLWQPSVCECEARKAEHISTVHLPSEVFMKQSPGDFTWKSEWNDCKADLREKLISWPLCNSRRDWKTHQSRKWSECEWTFEKVPVIGDTSVPTGRNSGLLYWLDLIAVAGWAQAPLSCRLYSDFMFKRCTKLLFNQMFDCWTSLSSCCCKFYWTFTVCVFVSVSPAAVSCKRSSASHCCWPWWWSQLKYHKHKI